ncbi:hypothetical protein PISMIDRAFT_500212 [Pisolithus microcarpus 441]|uniref:Uncharacterized protein n=1 Tax=Pisolithus microcarpus 441 TaxID=765257 RepID=A0A0C9YM82_9AGAM|nr:hypothetical protein PISMIDRAFT_500212 [Pisolithus microcarpus 441]
MERRTPGRVPWIVAITSPLLFSLARPPEIVAASVRGDDLIPGSVLKSSRDREELVIMTTSATLDFDANLSEDSANKIMKLPGYPL